MAETTKRLVHETIEGEAYDYYPLGKFIVAAPGVCGGRPTFKYTRIEVEVVLDLLAAGESFDRLVENFRIASREKQLKKRCAYPLHC
jgi:uncharacterized protein (DUF433 family)